MKNPLISIIVPTYNSEKFISDMLFSLENQTYKNFEVIISDGVSNDKTLSLARGAKLDKVIIDSRPDKGIPDALNKGFSLANGDIVCWLNSDDFYVSRDALHHVAKAFSKVNTDYAYGHTLIVDESGAITDRLYTHQPIKGYEDRCNNLTTGSMFFSKSLWNSFGGFSGLYKYGFEYEIKKYLSLHSKSTALINQFIGSLRIHSDTVTSTYNNKIENECALIFSDKPHISEAKIRLERYLSQLLQGTLLPAVISKIYSKETGKNWKSYF